MAAGGRRLMPVDRERIVLEMGYTADEFRAVLPRALRNYQLSAQDVGSWHITSQDSDLTVNLSIATRPDRQIAALSLPVLAVTMSFGSGTEAARRRFRQSFQRGFQKGGG